MTSIEIFKNERVLSLQKFKYYFFGQNMQRYILMTCVFQEDSYLFLLYLAVDGSTPLKGAWLD